MFQARSLVILLALFLGSLGASFLLFHPTVREFTQEVIFPDDREVLSSIRTKFYGKFYKIVKIRAQKRMYVEVYEWREDTRVYEIVDRAQLTDVKDAYYKIEDKKTNLFLKDIDEDEFPEIIIPTFDRNMIAHLNIFSFDVDNRKLVKLSRH